MCVCVHVCVCARVCVHACMHACLSVCMHYTCIHICSTVTYIFTIKNVLFIVGIQKLVLAGRMGEAIETTQQLYPGLLERNSDLLFMLKCRQFIEMVNGSDSEVRGVALRSPRSQTGGSNRSSPSRSPIHHTHSPRVSVGSHSGSSSPSRTKPIKIHTPSQSSLATVTSLSNSHVTSNNQDLKTETMNATNANVCLSVNNVTMNGSDSRLIEDVEMLDGIMEEDNNSVVTNGTSADGHYMNGDTFNDCDKEDNMGK